MKQSAPLARAPRSPHIRLTLWAGEKEGNSPMARRASRVKVG